MDWSFKSKKEAEKVLAEKLRDMYHGVNVDVSNDTLGQYMSDWLSQKETQVRPSTYRSYEWMVRLHLIPHIGQVKLSDLKPQHLQSLYAKLLRQAPPLSKRMVLHLHNMIHQALDRAVKWGMVGRNVADAVDPPRPESKEMQVWTVEEVRKFLKASRGDRYHAVYHLALSAGMRHGEILGLRWEDIDLDNRRLQIRRALQWSNGKPIFVPPKTAKSRRQITLGATVVGALRRHKVKQNEEKLRLGSLYNDQGLVFTALDGGPVSPRTVDEHWYECRDAADVPKIRFHDMRYPNVCISSATHMPVEPHGKPWDPSLVLGRTVVTSPSDLPRICL